jgi:hypothetical protein
MKNKKLVVGLISDGKYGKRAFQNIKRLFKAYWIPVPEINPNAMLDNDLDIDIPECDIYISYIRHPDIILQVAELQKPLILGVSPGIGLYQQAKAINPKVIHAPTMCSLENNTGIPEIDHFTTYFGRPIFKPIMDANGIFRDIIVLRSSLCGSSEAGARYLLNRQFAKKNLQDFALSVCYECRAPRFGHTCDKEVAGINHLVSLFNNIPLEILSRSNDELKSFIQNIFEEYKSRMINSRLLLEKVF